MFEVGKNDTYTVWK